MFERNLYEFSSPRARTKLDVSDAIVKGDDYLRGV